MAKRKEPAQIWVEDNLIKIKPVNCETIYFTDYSKKMFNLVYSVRWYITNNGYLRGTLKNSEEVLFHHLVLPKKEGFHCDHINRNKADNREINLRHVNYSESEVNKGLTKANTSGYIGVTWDKEREKWSAFIRVNKKSKRLGRFTNIEDAANAYMEAVEKYYPGILYC